MFGVMGAFLVAALATPEAFGDNALLFGVAYAVARWLHIFIFAEANESLDTGEAIRRLARTALPAPAAADPGRRSRRRHAAGRTLDPGARDWTSPAPTCSGCAASGSRPGTSPSASR